MKIFHLFQKENETQTSPLKIQHRLCPKCLKPGLQFIRGASFMQLVPRFYCPTCGYQGSVYVDQNAEDSEQVTHEWELIQEEFADEVEKHRTVKDLATDTLKHKWTPNQRANHTQLQAWCPFCEDAHNTCNRCLCPPEICASQAQAGLIGELNRKYSGTTELCEVEEEIYQKIVVAFQKLQMEDPDGKKRKNE